MTKQGETTMSANEQARALMMRHQQVVKNRQQTMLGRAAAEVGLDEMGNNADKQIRR